jgi:hypothetical protein
MAILLSEWLEKKLIAVDCMTDLIEKLGIKNDCV